VPQRVTAIVRRIRRSALPEILAVSLSTALAIIGATFLITPERYTSPTWRPLWAFASPAAWATVMILTGAITALVVLTRREWAPAPMIAQAGIWGTLGALTTWGAVGGGVPSAAVIYTLPAWLCLVLVLIYASEALEPADGPRR